MEIAVKTYYLTSPVEVVHSLIEEFRSNAHHYVRGTTQALFRNCRLIRDHRNSSKLEEMLTLRKDQLSQTFIRQSMLTPFISASYSSIKQKVAVPMVNIDFYVADTFSREVSQIRKTLTQRLSAKV